MAVGEELAAKYRGFLAHTSNAKPNADGCEAEPWEVVYARYGVCSTNIKDAEQVQEVQAK